MNKMVKFTFGKDSKEYLECIRVEFKEKYASWVITGARNQMLFDELCELRHELGSRLSSEEYQKFIHGECTIFLHNSRVTKRR